MTTNEECGYCMLYNQQIPGYIVMSYAKMCSFDTLKGIVW